MKAITHLRYTLKWERNDENYYRFKTKFKKNLSSNITGFQFPACKDANFRTAVVDHVINWSRVERTNLRPVFSPNSISTDFCESPLSLSLVRFQFILQRFHLCINFVLKISIMGIFLLRLTTSTKVRWREVHMYRCSF